MLLCVVAFAADKLLPPGTLSWAYLHHNAPRWWQWVTHMFFHADLAHLSNNMFMLLVFGRLCEDTEGAWGLGFTFLVCGIGAAVASWFLTTKAAVSVGASGAIFGLFSVSTLARLANFNLKNLLESVVLGNFVLRQVADELRAQAAGGSLTASGLQVSHLAHLGGALVGVLLVMLLSRLPKDE